VFHYDLSWSPTRHDSAKGGVDRFGQPKDTVRVLTLLRKDNPVDGIVLDLLIRKAQHHPQLPGDLRARPVDTDAAVEAIFEGW